ncbi:bifunctional phosphopantothenoylcysteine decarboxylase/phosphopantothenate--cysteine ligase CoaBC [Parvularcula sp. ZS-1/3]|uniref:Coenzyme A biosynthesis bifunctional protein CoaBC n=1 Tax=Parvularcula mediterranea TaxID=2732508 RepID=A0A7Y3RKQ3_9PROT|nr:bifunctional phosphopantothenoylcysteine decarboxylase/phosphopantothenate--cysteine ligase CoaBC [Parvularcula mediterranea]NNU15844.1 bifunctional phosphopantothenoylcysteine decarboxylase/phosphopantothenate--cysteine ligase CoaBC [Parvularcula mediterranea]
MTSEEHRSRRVLLVVGGGIAAYKSLELARELSKRGVTVTSVLTKGGAEFVTPLSLSGLTGEKCYTDLFSLTDEVEMGHIELSRSADLVLVAPATADLMAKAAQGLANDLASTLLLATDKKVLFAPAMNVKMWEHPATRRNLAQLREDGAEFVGPGEGAMACGEFGEGRLAEPWEIADAAEKLLPAPQGRLSGRKVVITAGPTHEPVDPVRFVGNRSSGKQGYAIAAACRNEGADVTLISGPVSLPAPSGCDVIHVQTAREMMAATEQALPADVFIACAAVADYRPAVETPHKVKKERGGLTAIDLIENPDILATISQLDVGRPQLVVGFAAETDDVLGHAETKRARKKCDWIVANDVSPGTPSMGGDKNEVTIITGDDDESLPMMAKDMLGAHLARRIADKLDQG